MSNAKQKNKQRTYARNRIFSRRGYEKRVESDGLYFLKLVSVIILGTVWIKFATLQTVLGLPVYGIPIGLIVGLIVVRSFEKYQFDRKIWYALLVLSTIVSYFLPAGFLL